MMKGMLAILAMAMTTTAWAGGGEHSPPKPNPTTSPAVTVNVPVTNTIKPETNVNNEAEAQARAAAEATALAKQQQSMTTKVGVDSHDVTNVVVKPKTEIENNTTNVMKAGDTHVDVSAPITVNVEKDPTHVMGGSGGHGGAGGAGGAGGQAASSATIEKGAVNAAPVANGGNVTGSGNSENHNSNAATGGSVTGSGNSTAAGGSVTGSGNATVDAGVKDSGNAKVNVDSHDKVISISPHAALVPNAPTPTVFESSKGANAAGARFEVVLSRLCSMSVTPKVKRIRTEGESDETDIVFTPFARDAYAGAGSSEALIVENGTMTDTQRYRCVGSLLVQGKPKKAEYVDLASIQYDALLFAKAKLGGARVLGLMFDACSVSVNNGVLTFGHGLGASAGGSSVWNDALGTLMGGLSGNKGRSLNFSQLGATYVVIAPTERDGPGTFTLGDIAKLLAPTPAVAQATPSGK